MRRSAYHYSPEAFGIASYAKPAAALIALRAVLGEEVFLRGYRGFLREWRYRHPYPWDFFNSFEAASGQDLDWFWHAWYFTTWTLDQAIDGVSADADSTRIFVTNPGRMPMPVTLRVTLANGTTLTETMPVAHWLAGHRRAEVVVATPSPAVRIEIDPERSYPDVDRENNVWVGSGER
jgi:aminopeptidase N